MHRGICWKPEPTKEKREHRFTNTEPVDRDWRHLHDEAHGDEHRAQENRQRNRESFCSQQVKGDDCDLHDQRARERADQRRRRFSKFDHGIFEPLRAFGDPRFLECSQGQQCVAY